MTPLPKKKHTRSRSRIRRGAQKMILSSLAKCPSCGKLKQNHRACRYCGYYSK